MKLLICLYLTEFGVGLCLAFGIIGPHVTAKARETGMPPHFVPFLDLPSLLRAKVANNEVLHNPNALPSQAEIKL